MIHIAAPDTGQENATTIKLTQEDVEKIKSLPKRTFLIGNLQQTGLYDEKTRRFYYLDANGEWNGRLAIINTPPPPPPPSDEEEPEDEGPSEDESVDDGSDGGDTPTSLADKAKGLFSFLKKKGDSAESPIMEKLHTPISKRLPLTWMHVVIIGVILLLLMVFVITPAVNRVFAPPDVPPASSTEVTPPSGQQGTEGENPQTSEPDPTLSNIQVIQVKDIMIPQKSAPQIMSCCGPMDVSCTSGKRSITSLAWSSTSISRKAGTSPPVMRVRHTPLLQILGSTNSLG